MIKKVIQFVQEKFKNCLFIGPRKPQAGETGGLGFKVQGLKSKKQGSKGCASWPCQAADPSTDKQNVPSSLTAPGSPLVADIPLMRQIEEFLSAHYEFRFNQLTEQPEYRRKRSRGSFIMADQRAVNTLCIEAQLQGINCWDKDISRLLCSHMVADHHPFHAYMQSLPAWDGTDRVTPLALRVSDSAVWLMGFHRWMRGMTAQWMGIASQSANAVAPLLVSTEQGLCKSTFCALLMPPALHAFYLDKFDITSVSGCEQKLSHFGLINMDEFDRYRDRAMATLKNLMQLRRLNVRKSHRSYYSQLPRIASFIGTSNQRELLTDPTGSRRFLCVEVSRAIDCSPIDHAQLYAQLKHELEQGLPHWFTHDEERLIQERNRPFYRRLPEHDVFFRCFRQPHEGEKGISLSATEIYLHLQKRFPAAMRGRHAGNMGKTLSALGINHIHTRTGNVYRVVKV